MRWLGEGTGAAEMVESKDHAGQMGRNKRGREVPTSRHTMSSTAGEAATMDGQTERRAKTLIKENEKWDPNWSCGRRNHTGDRIRRSVCGENAQSWRSAGQMISNPAGVRCQ